MAGMPPQFLKNANGAPPTLPADKKKKARQSAIAAMQKQDASLDAKLGPNDLPDAPAAPPAKGQQPPWLKKGK